MNALIDTNVLIEFLNGAPEAKAELDRYRNPRISVISWIEVLAGTKPPMEAGTRRCLDGFERIGIDERIAERCVELRRTRRLRISDALILATAMIGGLLLVTRNSKEFPADLPGVRIPYRI